MDQESDFRTDIAVKDSASVHLAYSGKDGLASAPAPPPPAGIPLFSSRIQRDQAGPVHIVHDQIGGAVFLKEILIRNDAVDPLAASKGFRLLSEAPHGFRGSRAPIPQKPGGPVPPFLLASFIGKNSFTACCSFLLQINRDVGNAETARAQAAPQQVTGSDDG